MTKSRRAPPPSLRLNRQATSGSVPEPTENARPTSTDLPTLRPFAPGSASKSQTITVPPQSSASATPAWSSSLSDRFAGLPALRKQALKMKNGKATTTWSVPAELHKFHLARADQLTFDRPNHLFMLWCCVLMCRIQHGDEVSNRMADGEVFVIPKPGGSGPDFLRSSNLLDSTGELNFQYWLSCLLVPIQTLAVWFH